MVEQRIKDTLGAEDIPAVVVDWQAVTSLSEETGMEDDNNRLDPEDTIGDLSEAELVGQKRTKEV
jgi:hypothetical protein